MNLIVLMGNLTKDIELRYSSSGTPWATSGIAVNKKSKNLKGELVEETLFLDLTFLGKTAEIVNQYFVKGSKILIKGELKQRNWQESSGQNRTNFSVLVESFDFVGNQHHQQPQQQQQNNYQPQPQNYKPQQQQQQHQQQQFDDDLPF